MSSDGRVRWFGPEPFAPACDDEYRVPMPDDPCTWCGEGFTLPDQGFIVSGGGPFHDHCFLRQIIGSVAHQRCECSCYGGSGEDDPALTLREAARAAVLFFFRSSPQCTCRTCGCVASDHVTDGSCLGCGRAECWR